MKKYFLFALLIACGFVSTAQSEDAIYNAEDIKSCEERPDIKCSTSHAVLQGIVQEKYADGSLKSETPYKGGYKYGLERVYYEVKMPWNKPGRVQFENTYKYNKLLVRKEYYENGSIKMIINNEEGTTQVYREDGTLRAKQN